MVYIVFLDGDDEPKSIPEPENKNGNQDTSLMVPETKVAVNGDGTNKV